jgi:hypothetical protein
MSQSAAHSPLSAALVGRSFVHPAFDYVFIGGALSLCVISIAVLNPGILPFFTGEDFRYFVLVSNNAHFAASTVRLYTKPDAKKSMPVVKIALPLVALAVVTLCMFRADSVGSNIRAFYFTWSPYHYAAQAYGLSVMYCYRSGCQISANDKRLLWWVCMLPFITTFVTANNVGLHWLDYGGWLGHPTAVIVVGQFKTIMPFVAYGAIPLLFWKIWRSETNTMPLISVLIILTNGVWWFTLDPPQAFIWATIFHGIQYLAIVIIFHVKDQLNRPSNRHGAAYHTVWFYAASLALGYSLFYWLPRAYIFAGFTPLASVWYTVAVINIHHFIVDAFIWRLKPSDNNRSIVDSQSSGSAVASVVT